MLLFSLFQHLPTPNSSFILTLTMPPKTVPKAKAKSKPKSTPVKKGGTKEKVKSKYKRKERKKPTTKNKKDPKKPEKSAPKSKPKSKISESKVESKLPESNKMEKGTPSTAALKRTASSKTEFPMESCPNPEDLKPTDITRLYKIPNDQFKTEGEVIAKEGYMLEEKV